MCTYLPVAHGALALLGSGLGLALDDQHPALLLRGVVAGAEAHGVLLQVVVGVRLVHGALQRHYDLSPLRRNVIIALQQGVIDHSS